MTLIALTINQGYPVLMADILLSSTEGVGIPVPTFIDGTDKLFMNADKKPVALTQKLYVINDRLALALGGRLDQMRTFLNRIQRLYGDAKFDNRDLDDFITNYPDEESNSLLAIIVRGDLAKDGVLDFNVRTIGSIYLTDTEKFDSVFAGGSGVSSFMKVVTSSSPLRSDIDDTDRFLASNLAAIGYFLSSEILDGKTLAGLWGAGFEMIIVEDGRFRKLKEYTVVVMWCEFGKEIEFNSAPIRTMLFSYQENSMIVQAIYNDKQQSFAIPQINDDGKSIEVKLSNPKHETLLIAYLYNDVDSDGHVYHSISVFPKNKNTTEGSPIVFSRDKSGRLRMSVDKKHDRDFFERSMELLKKQFPNLKSE
jgi:hypothetical protein